MNSLKNITYSLLVIISFSLFSVSAQASGISVRIGGSGYGYNAGYNSYSPSAYFAYNSPIVTYRHQYRPYYRHHSNSYYRGHGYRNHGYAQHSRQGYRSSHHDRRDNYRSGYTKRH